jgi:sarcosine dehydrogenase
VFDALMEAGRARGSGRWATARSNRCGSRRATAPGPPTSRPNDTPFEAGLGWAVKMKTNRPFIGREALEAVRAAR